MKVKIKKLSEDAIIPQYANPGDAGLDFYANTMRTDPKGYTEFGTGISMSVPKDHVGLIFPRSSISDYKMTLTNSVGVLDSSYSGEIKFRFKPTSTGGKLYKVGDKIGQMIIIPYPQIEFEEVDDLEETERGSGGFGHTGE